MKIGGPTTIKSLAWVWLAAIIGASSDAATPITLHPDNPHYFVWRGKPTVLVSSAEHYGGVLNLDFDYRKYLDALAADGLNYTRIFSGAYVEPDGAFNIQRNTLAPAAGRFICPWARSDRPGYANGGNKFDLSRWDDAYFARLRGFVSHAGERNVVVELTLFCPMYEQAQWQLSPMNAANNVNGLGNIDRARVYTLDGDAGLLAAQETLAGKIVSELQAFDNVFFEICNEPYFGGVTLAWQHHIADAIVATERGLPEKHLIAQNIANKSARIENPHPAVSIFNFHYAAPPDTVGINHHLQKVIGDDETGFRGTGDAAYRTEAWEFILAGGGLYNNLDYSFAAGYENGTFAYPASQPGGGNPAFRRQMKILSDFIHGFDFIRMQPDQAAIKDVAAGAKKARALVEPGQALAIYVRAEAPERMTEAVLQIELPDGDWQAQWLDPKSGEIVRDAPVKGGGIRSIRSHPFETDIALRLLRR